MNSREPSRSILGQLFESFIRTQGWLVGIVGVLIALFFIPSSNLELKWFILAGVLWLLLLAMLIDFSYRTYNRAKSPIPHVLRAIMEPKDQSPAGYILLLEPSPLYGHESVVSIYEKDDEFERLIGIGYVNTIKEDGKIQILVTEISKGNEAAKDRFSKNDASYLKQIVVKPTLPRSFLKIGD